MVMRKLTVTYELPEELFLILEEQAKREGRPMEDVIAEYRLESRPVRPKLLSHFGAWDGGDPHGSDNERIDEDLAREYGSGL